MANMSHCRFENTSQDLEDCIEAAQQLVNNNGLDEDGDTISRRERDAMAEMVSQMEAAIELFEQALDSTE